MSIIDHMKVVVFLSRYSCTRLFFYDLNLMLQLELKDL